MVVALILVQTKAAAYAATAVFVAGGLTGTTAPAPTLVNEPRLT